ncbi:YjbH domain-containing protein [Sinirhodobacter sp. WL0062]|uniref:YjbH domain-containing protein n=1 Tax=Rhodobacter flavimaris TaxID=2907145 RepID=A0ABS8YWQ9_9RHOB|nr:YjbH domain-containing protein [Sinirhodobacter sp. WL0062]
MAHKVSKIAQISTLALIAGSLPMAFESPAHAEPTIGWSLGTYGAPGLIDMPTAEVNKDGELVASVYGYGKSGRGNFSFQIAPQLTAVLRVSNEDGLADDGGALRDRSFDLHWQVLSEEGMRPALAIGLRDLMGGGIHGSEYIVATKTLNPSLRGTVGLGWGRLGSEGSFGGGTRPVTDPTGGLNTEAWFRGPAAVFAGLAWQANDKLTLKAEYSSDAYEAETAAAGFDRKSSLNFGADYKINSMVKLSGYYLAGSEVGLQLTVALDPRHPPAPSGLEKAPLPVRPRPNPAADPDGWSGAWTADPTAQPAIQTAVADALRKDGQILDSMQLSADSVNVRVRNQIYAAPPQAIGHTARVLTRALPPSVETITVTQISNGMPTSSVTFRRSDLERLENTQAGEILAAAQIGEAETAGAYVPTEGLYPRLQFGLRPYAEFSTYEKDADLYADMGVQLSARYEIMPGLILSGAVNQKVFGNLDEQTKVSTSTVPHVRSDIAEYQKHGDLALQRLTLAWYGRPAENLYSRVTVGYLEQMYGGVSGEILWKPVDSRLALGGELNWVKQRDYDQRFEFLDYDTLSGHLSAYYDFGSGVTGSVDVGRYLAEDWGATFSVDRELANGWSVGAFATVTDMSSDEFGPGAFDKGVKLRIPLSWATGKPSLATFTPTIRPYVGDGGARVDVDGRLYESVRKTHMGALYQDWGRFWR